MMFLTLFALTTCTAVEQDALLPPDVALASLDLGFVLDDLIIKDLLPEDIANRTLRDYRRFLSIVLDKEDDEDFKGEPGYLVDLAWHRHILHTKAYWNDTLSIFGHYLTHQPGESAKDVQVGAEAIQRRSEKTSDPTNSRPEQTLQAYRLKFGEEPDLALWDWAVQRRRLFSNPNGAPYWNTNFDYQQISRSDPEPKLGKGGIGCFYDCFYKKDKLGAGEAKLGKPHCAVTCSLAPCCAGDKLGAGELSPEPKLGKPLCVVAPCCAGDKLGAGDELYGGAGDVATGWRRLPQTGPTPIQEAVQEISTADLAFLESRLEHTEGKSVKKAKEMVALYRDFLTEAAKEGRLGEEGLRATNSEVELVWEMHILFTNRYREFSEKIFGRYIHHA